MTTLSGEQLYNWLLEQETTGDDDQRFYSSYLLGHVSLAIADTENEPDLFQTQLTSSLNDALAIDKLSESDITGIRLLLNQAMPAVVA